MNELEGRNSDDDIIPIVNETAGDALNPPKKVGAMEMNSQHFIKQVNGQNPQNIDKDKVTRTTIKPLWAIIFIFYSVVVSTMALFTAMNIGTTQNECACVMDSSDAKTEIIPIASDNSSICNEVDYCLQNTGICV